MREGWKETTLGDESAHQGGHICIVRLLFPPRWARIHDNQMRREGRGFSAEGLKYYKGAYLEEQVLHAGDLVIALTDLTRAGDIVGGPVLVPNFGAGATVLPSMDLAILRPTSVESNLTFLFYRLMLPDARRYMLAYAGGTTVLPSHNQSRPEVRVPGASSVRPDQDRRNPLHGRRGHRAHRSTDRQDAADQGRSNARPLHPRRYPGRSAPAPSRRSPAAL